MPHSSNNFTIELDTTDKKNPPIFNHNCTFLQLMWWEEFVGCKIVTTKSYFNFKEIPTCKSHLPKTQILNIILFQTKCFMFNLCIISKSRFLHILDCRGDKGYRQTLPQSKVKWGPQILLIEDWTFIVEASRKYTARSNIHADHLAQTAFTSVIKEWSGPVHATNIRSPLPCTFGILCNVRTCECYTC